MNRQQILEEVQEIARSKLELKAPLSLETDLLHDLQLDSLLQLTLVVEVENHFRICLEIDGQGDLATVADVVDRIAEGLAADEPTSGARPRPEHVP